MDDKQATVLFVDDEVSILNALKRLLRKENYNLVTTTSSEEALEILSEKKIHVVVSDQRMPGMDGVTFLKKVKETYPDIIRITLTGYTDVDTIRDAINQGHIYKFLLKPWNDDNLILEIRQALHQYELMNVNRELNQKVLEQNRALKHLNDQLENLIKERTEELLIRNEALELEQAILAGLPFPIMGISEEGIIVMTNLALDDMFHESVDFQIGRNIREYFPEETTQLILKSISDTTCVEMMTCSLEGIDFKFQCTTLSGRFHGRGLVLSFSRL